MELGHPIENFTWNNVSQYFGVSAEYYRRKFNLPYHNAIDIVSLTSRLGYGANLLATHDFDTVDVETDYPTKTKGNGIRLRGKIDKPFFLQGVEAHYIETIHWHISDFSVEVPSSGKKGDIVALMGNTGQVYPKPSNNCDLCPYYGTHSHYGGRFYDRYGKLIKNEVSGYRDLVPYTFKEGEVLKRICFDRDLFMYSQGDDVSWLQTILKIEGFAHDYDPIGHYGSKTLRDVALLQRKYGITPSIGYLGAKTRKFIRDKYISPKH